MNLNLWVNRLLSSTMYAKANVTVWDLSNVAVVVVVPFSFYRLT